MSETLQTGNVVSSGYFAQNRSEMLGYIPSTTKHLLDIGCGTGVFGNQVKLLHQSEVWGIELVKDAAVIAERQLDRVILEDISVALGSLPDFYFDCISCNDVLEHLVDPFNILSNLKKKLTSNGVIVCSIPNVRYWNNLKALVIDKQWKYEDSGILDRTHLRFFTERSLRDMFISLGFEILRLEGINPTRSRNFTLFNFFTGGAFTDAKYLQFACVVRPK